jgi:hypothetical protein
MTMNQQVPVLSFPVNNIFPDLGINKQSFMSPQNGKKTIMVRESQIKRTVAKKSTSQMNAPVFRTQQHSPKHVSSPHRLPSVNQNSIITMKDQRLNDTNGGQR